MSSAKLAAVALALGAWLLGSSSGATGAVGAVRASAAVPWATTELSVFFLRSGRLQPVRRMLPKTQAVAAAALRQLLAGPSLAERRAGLASAVPKGTRLLSVSVRSEIATVDLGGRFAAGGGSLSVRGRLAQLVFTLTQFPTVQAVRLELDGKPVSQFSGEGLIIDHALARDAFDDILPQVLIEAPLTGDRVPARVAVTGSADVFEGVFRLRLRDARGHVVAETRVQAPSGTGTRGPFHAALRVPRGVEGAMVLEAMVQSPKDGTWRVADQSRVEVAP